MSWKKYLLLFLTTFIIFNLNFTPIATGDSIPAALLPFNIFAGRGIFFNEYSALFAHYYNFSPYFFEPFGNYKISSFPIISGILAIPIYLPAYLILTSRGITSPLSLMNYAFIIEKLAASIIASISVVSFFYLLSLISKNPKTSLLFSLIFAFGTQTFSISSQALWQHGTANLFIILSLIAFLKGCKSLNPFTLNLSILFGGLAFASRSSFLLYLITLTLLIIKHSSKNKWKFLLVFIFISSAIFGHNIFFYKSLFGDRLRYVNAFDITNIPGAFAGLFFSSARGVLIYTPIYLLSFALFLYKKRLYQEKYLPIIKLSGISCLLIIGLYSLWGLWWGGWAWGNRFFADLAVLAILLVYFVYKYALEHKHTYLLLLIYILASYSVSIQLIGVFNYPNTAWDNYPGNIDKNPSRQWQISDNPIHRSLAIGPNLSNGPRLYYWLTHKKKPGIYKGIERNCTLKVLAQNTWLGYSKIKLAFSNNSSVDWITVGEDPFMDDLTLVQIYLLSGKTSEIISPITPANLPQVIHAHETITVETVLIPPNQTYKSVKITPAQANMLWHNSCQIEI